MKLIALCNNYCYHIPMVVLIALIPFFTWAISDIFGTFASRKIGNISTNLGFLLFSFLFISCYLPFAGGVSSIPYLLLALLLGGIHVFGLLTYFKGLEIGNSSMVGAIVGSFSALVVVLSVLIFHDQLTQFQILGVVSIVCGLFITSFNFEMFRGANKVKNIISDPGIKFAFITFFAWGVYFALIRIPVEHIGWYWSLYPATFYIFPLLLFPKMQQAVSQLKLDKTTLFQILGMTILGRLGDVTYNIALTKGYSTIVGAIAGSSPVAFVILSRFFLKDKLTLQQKIGVAVTALGIISIAFASII